MLDPVKGETGRDPPYQNPPGRPRPTLDPDGTSVIVKRERDCRTATQNSLPAGAGTTGRAGKRYRYALPQNCRHRAQGPAFCRQVGVQKHRIPTRFIA